MILPFLRAPITLRRPAASRGLPVEIVVEDLDLRLLLQIGDDARQGALRWHPPGAATTRFDLMKSRTVILFGGGTLSSSERSLRVEPVGDLHDVVPEVGLDDPAGLALLQLEDGSKNAVP